MTTMTTTPTQPTPTQTHRAVAPPPGHYTRCLREEYVLICGGDPCAAMILSQHEFWHTHNMRRRPDGDPWSAMSYPQMRDQLFGLFSAKRVAEAYQSLVARGFLARRTNPMRPTDRTFQYRFAVEAVQEAMNALPTAPSDAVQAPSDAVQAPSDAVQAPSRTLASAPTDSCNCPDGGVSVKNIRSYNSTKTNPQTAPGDPSRLARASPPSPETGEGTKKAVLSSPPPGGRGSAKPGGRSPAEDLRLVGELVSFGMAFEEAQALTRAYGPARCRLVLDHLPPYPTPHRQARWLRKALTEGWSVGPPPRAWTITGASDLDTLLAAHGRLPVVLEVERRAADPGIPPAVADRRRRVAAGLRAGLTGHAAHTAAGYAPDG